MCDDPRFSDDVQFSDAEVRAQLQMMQIDAIMMKARLRYLARIVRNKPIDLVTLLHQRVNGKCLPWICLIAADCRKLQALQLVDPPLPCIMEHPAPWHDLISDTNAWNNIVDKVWLLESMLGKSAADNTSPLELTFKCRTCNKLFASKHALRSHEMMKHGKRMPIRRHIGGATCHACGKDFHTQVRLLLHVRRTGCEKWIKKHCKPLTDAAMQSLDAAGSAERLKAQRAGKTGPIVSRPPIRTDGSVVLPGRQPSTRPKMKCSVRWPCD